VAKIGFKLQYQCFYSKKYKLTLNRKGSLQGKKRKVFMVCLGLQRLTHRRAALPECDLSSERGLTMPLGTRLHASIIWRSKSAEKSLRA
jgi:hypothetical protein